MDPSKNGDIPASYVIVYQRVILFGDFCLVTMSLTKVLNLDRFGKKLPIYLQDPYIIMVY